VKSVLFRGAAACAAAALLIVSSVRAQSESGRSLEGTVLLGDQPVPGVPVTLHRVTPEESGPLGQQVSGPDGSFRFALPAADTAGFEVFFATAEYATVRYFGEPIHRGAAVADYAIAVFDTASALPGAIRVARRDVVLIPEAQGGWEANEIIRLHNGADRTLVSAGGMPTWEITLPAGITDFQAGEGDLTAAEVSRMGDRVLVLAPLIPGDRELFLRYRIPQSLELAALEIGAPTDTMNVFIGQPSPAVEVTGLTTTKVVEAQGEQFVQYGTTSLVEGDEVTLAWDAPAAAPVAPEVAGGAAALVVLLVGSWFAFRNRGSAGASATGPARAA
jgi:hypothetical protein